MNHFRLVIPCEQDYTGEVEIIDNQRWRLSDPMQPTHVPKFCTISYTWGDETSPNLFALPSNVSSRTFRALEAAIKANVDSPVQAYWIDAVCVPLSGPERLATLESMGYIYHKADTGIVVLEQPVFELITRSHRDKRILTVSEMALLDRDRWVTSVWTYQELVNAGGKTFFTTYQMETPAKQHAEILFSVVGQSMERWRIDGNKSYQEVLETFPGLNTLDDTLADWEMALYLDMSALTCITGIFKRKCAPDRPTNRLYALFGVLTQEPSWGPSADESVAELTEKAMQICEAKEDYSFIYTANARAEQPTWRPQPDNTLGLVPILSWHSFGGTQPAIRHQRRLSLQQMVYLDVTKEPSEKAIQDGMKWLSEFVMYEVTSIQNQLPKALAIIGMRAGAACLECEYGFVLLHEAISPGETLEVYASTTVRWAFGAPGIAKVMRDGICLRYIVIVYFGIPLDRVEAKVTVELDD